MPINMQDMRSVRYLNVAVVKPKRIRVPDFTIKADFLNWFEKKYNRLPRVYEMYL